MHPGYEILSSVRLLWRPSEERTADFLRSLGGGEKALSSLRGPRGECLERFLRYHWFAALGANALSTCSRR